MTINVLQWHRGIGIFYYCSQPFIKNMFIFSNCFFKVRCVISYLYYFLCSLILLTHVDIETNPGPKKFHLYFSCCHWNPNSLIAHNMQKVSSLEAYNTRHNMISFVLVKCILVLRLNQIMLISESMILNYF